MDFYIGHTEPHATSHSGIAATRKDRIARFRGACLFASPRSAHLAFLQLRVGRCMMWLRGVDSHRHHCHHWCCRCFCQQSKLKACVVRESGIAASCSKRRAAPPLLDVCKSSRKCFERIALLFCKATTAAPPLLDHICRKIKFVLHRVVSAKLIVLPPSPCRGDSPQWMGENDGGYLMSNWPHSEACCTEGGSQ